MLIWTAETRKFIILFIIVIELSGVQFDLKSYRLDFNIERARRASSI